MSIISQYNIENKINQAEFYIDYIHEWFSIYYPDISDEEYEQSKINLNNLEFEGHRLSFLLSIDFKTFASQREKSSFVNSSIIVKFSCKKDRDYVLRLGVQLRNFFHFVLKRKLGIYKIILNKENIIIHKDNFVSDDIRENWFLDQSFLPKIINDNKTDYEIKYKKIRNKFESILKDFLINVKLQEFITRFLMVSQYKMPIIPVLITLCSAVESYFNNVKFSNGKEVKNLKNKLNMIFNRTWQTKIETKDIVCTIKEQRDYYVHGVTPKIILSEVELIPVVEELILAIRNYLLIEMNLRE